MSKPAKNMTFEECQQLSEMHFDDWFGKLFNESKPGVERETLLAIKREMQFFFTQIDTQNTMQDLMRIAISSMEKEVNQ